MEGQPCWARWRNCVHLAVIVIPEYIEKMCILSYFVNHTRSWALSECDFSVPKAVYTSDSSPSLLWLIDWLIDWSWSWVQEEQPGDGGSGYSWFTRFAGEDILRVACRTELSTYIHTGYVVWNHGASCMLSSPTLWMEEGIFISIDIYEGACRCAG